LKPYSVMKLYSIMNAVPEVAGDGITIWSFQ
jgi:hypothetical protein